MMKCIFCQQLMMLNTNIRVFSVYEDSKYDEYYCANCIDLSNNSNSDAGNSLCIFIIDKKLKTLTVSDLFLDLGDRQYTLHINYISNDCSLYNISHFGKAQYLQKSIIDIFIPIEQLKQQIKNWIIFS